MIENGKIILFKNPGDTKGCGKALDLPSIPSIVQRKIISFTMKTEGRLEKFPSSLCKGYVNGTLHVYGRQTTQNLFHASKL